MCEKRDIKSYSLIELKEQMENMGEKAFRAKQIFQWLHKEKVERFEEMTNLSKSLRQKMNENYEILTVTPVDIVISN